MKNNVTLQLGLVAALAAGSAGLQAQTLRSWMDPEIQGAWNSNYKGQGVTIQVIDQFKGGSPIRGNLGTGSLLLRHGEWTRMEASMVAPSATVVSTDYSATSAIRLTTGKLNVLNLSYGMYASEGYATNQIGWSAQEQSIINYAKDGQAVIAKAAGNDAVAVGAAKAGSVDYLNRALIGPATSTAIFVGALSKNGTVASPAEMASYSNFAGSNAQVQAKFLVVGVEGSKTGLYGTSFAAPIITGYAAILGTKFNTATPTVIANRLLDTARTTTILNYNAAVHGRGEASIGNALAPNKIIN